MPNNERLLSDEAIEQKVGIINGVMPLLATREGGINISHEIATNPDLDVTKTSLALIYLDELFTSQQKKEPDVVPSTSRSTKSSGKSNKTRDPVVAPQRADDNSDGAKPKHPAPSVGNIKPPKAT